MFLSVKEMELRKIRFDESFAPGQIDFSGESLEQETPLRASGSAELLPHTGGEVRIQGKYAVQMSAVCDRCLGAIPQSFRPVSMHPGMHAAKCRSGIRHAERLGPQFGE